MNVKLKTFKVFPRINELYCDCGGKLRIDVDCTNVFNILFTKEEVNYTYICEKCNKKFTSKEKYKINEIYHCYGEVIEEKEIELKECENNESN